MSDSPWSSGGDSAEGDFVPEGDQDTVYSNPEAAVEHLRDRGYSDREIKELGYDLDDIEKADVDREAIEDALLSAINKSSWWIDTEFEGDLSKAPGIWRHSSQVPEQVREHIEEVIAETDWDWSEFESITAQQAEELAELIEEKLTQPQGWSIESIAEDVQEQFDLREDIAIGISADTTHNVLNVAREENYEEMEGSEDFVYEWINPQDHRTTEVCREIIAEIEDQGGAVPKDELQQILEDKAKKYEGTSEGGTPDRVDVWEPHYQCRSVMVRAVQAI